MRGALLAVALLLPAVPLGAQQPAPDAPVARHVAYLLDAARDGFAGLRGPVTFVPGTTLFSTEIESRYVMRFQGAAVASQVRLNPTWNVMHVSWLPVTGGYAAVDSVLARLASEIAAVVPAGWQRATGATGFAGWVECGFAGRELSLQRSLPSQPPAITLIVYKFDKPCDSGGSAASRPPE